MSAGFSFGGPKSTGAPSGSLFGNAPPTSGGGLFGSTPATTSSGSVGGLFSFPNNSDSTNKNQSTSSLFGNTSTGNTGNTGNTGSGSGAIFGQESGGGAGSAPSFSFSKPTEASKPVEASKSPFSGFGQQTPATPATPSTAAGAQGGSLFGASTGASSGSQFTSTTPAPQKFSFGGSTTPAGPPPAPSLFGGSTGGNNTTSQGQTSSSAGSGLFGPVQPSTTTSVQGNTFKGFANSAQPTPTSTTSLFGPVTSAEPNKPSSLFTNSSAAGPVSSAQAEAAPSVNKAALSFTSGSSTSGPEASKGLFGGLSGTGQSTGSATGTNVSNTLFGTTAGPGAASQGTVSSTPSFSFPTSTSQETAKPTSGFSFPSSTTSQEAPKSTPAFSFPENTAPSSMTTATTAPATSGLFSGLGAQSSSCASQSQSNTSTNAPVLSLGTVNGNAPERCTPALGTSTSGPAPTSQSRLRNKTMDEILTRWASDLTKYTKEFRSHAETIAHWDQMLVDNMSKISKLYSQTFTAEKQTDSVDMQLTAVENQQNELDYWMNSYEKIVDDMLEKNAGNVSELGGPDQDRERTYKLAEKLGEKLEDMSRDLEAMVEEVNAANAEISAGKKGDEPITQIVRILNSHLVQLQAIDQGTAALQAKVAAAQKNAGTLGYLNGEGGGTSGVAVDDFYQSYMGRRS